MTRLADLLNPDHWLASGKNLSDFPWPEDNNERGAIKLILSAHPELDAHLERWTRRVKERSGGRGIASIGHTFTEEYLRELWERTRISR